jgi:hypothetical protein
MDQEIQPLVTKEDVYQRSRRQALALLEEGLHLGGVIRANRDELHERKDFALAAAIHARSVIDA